MMPLWHLSRLHHQVTAEFLCSKDSLAVGVLEVHVHLRRLRHPNPHLPLPKAFGDHLLLALADALDERTAA